MAIAAIDLQQPKGHLDPKLFPGLDQTAFDAMLTEYIAQATSRASALNVDSADVDAYVEATAYCRGYTRVAQRLLATPTSAGIEGEAQRQYDVRQAEGFQRIADGWCAKADALIPPDETPNAPERSSGTLRNRPVW